MLVSELIEQLKDLPQDYEVVFCDPDATNDWAPVGDVGIHDVDEEDDYGPLEDRYGLTEWYQAVYLTP